MKETKQADWTRRQRDKRLGKEHALCFVATSHLVFRHFACAWSVWTIPRWNRGVKRRFKDPMGIKAWRFFPHATHITDTTQQPHSTRDITHSHVWHTTQSHDTEHDHTKHATEETTDDHRIHTFKKGEQPAMKRLSVRTDLALHDFTLSELTVFPEEQTCFGSQWTCPWVCSWER